MTKVTVTISIDDSPPVTVINTSTPQPAVTLPDPPPAIAVDHKIVDGIAGLYFSLEKKTVRVGEEIWFRFTVKNTTDKDIRYSGIGAVIDNHKSQVSWGDATLKAGEVLDWRDHMQYDKAGVYNVYLAYCWGGKNRGECENVIDRNGWEWLSLPVELTITE